MRRGRFLVTSLLPLKDAYAFCAKLPTALTAAEPVITAKFTNSEKDVGNFNPSAVIFNCSSPGLTEIIYDKEQKVHTISTGQLRIVNNYSLMFYFIPSACKMFHI